MTSTKGGKVFILMKDSTVLGVWSSLKPLCEDFRKQNPLFASYGKLSKIDKSSGELSFSSKDGVNYRILIRVVK